MNSDGYPLAAPVSAAVRRRAEECDHELLRLILGRAEAGSLPGDRSDPHRLALVIEGGGMGGAVSAGMCVLLEALDLIGAFDMIVACSAGALNGAWTAAGRAAQGATNYEDLASRAFLNPWRLLIGRPPIDFGLLFDGIAESRKPITAEQLAGGPAFHCLVTSLSRGTLEAFSDFASPRELLRAVRASCTLPVLAGPPVEIGGEQYADGGLIESMPFGYAFGIGATHALVLRSRSADYRKGDYGRLQLMLVRRMQPALLELVRARPGHYNDEAQTLERAMSSGRPDLFAIAPPPDAPQVGQLERDRDKVAAGLRAGAVAAAETFCGAPVDLLWEPRPYTLSESA